MNHIKRFDTFKINESKTDTKKCKEYGCKDCDKECKKHKKLNEEILGTLFSSKGRNKEAMKTKLANHIKVYANQAINGDLIKGYEDLEFNDFQSVADKLYEVDFDATKITDTKDKAIATYLMKRCQASVDSTGRKAFGFGMS
jgi:hypothetical protein